MVYNTMHMIQVIQINMTNNKGNEKSKTSLSVTKKQINYLHIKHT